MRISTVLKYTSIAFLLGGGVTAALLVWFSAAPTNQVPIVLARIVAWSGFKLAKHFYQGFPVDASLTATNLLLVLFGGIQSALVALPIGLMVMKRRSLIAILAFVVLGVSLLAYFLSSTSATAWNVRVALAMDNGGHQAVLQNAGLRPVVVTTCDVMSDVVGRSDWFVGDGVQRRSANGEWRTVLKRDFCNGTTKLRLLWPRRKMYSARFHPNVGFQFRKGESFQRGDMLRFVLFPNSGLNGVASEATELYSPAFTVD